MKKHTLTAGQIASRLTAEKMGPLVEYVEQATNIKLRLPHQQQADKPHKPKKGHEDRQ